MNVILYNVDGGDFAINQYKKMYGDTTPEQKDTVNGLFSGRIKFEGLKLAQQDFSCMKRRKLK